MKLLMLFEAIADTAFVKLMEGVAYALGDRPEPEPVYAMGDTVEAVLTQLCPDTVWEEGGPFCYDPTTAELSVPRLADTDLESRIKAAHEAFHARRHAAGAPAYTELPNDRELESWTVGQLWSLFREERATNRELRRWLWRRMGPWNPQVMAITTRMNTAYFALWAQRFFTLRWRGVKATQGQAQAGFAADPSDRFDYLEVDGAENMPPAEGKARAIPQTGAREMFRWLGSGVVMCAFVMPLLTFARLLAMGMMGANPFTVLLGLLGAYGALMAAFFLCRKLH